MPPPRPDAARRRLPALCGWLSVAGLSVVGLSVVLSVLSGRAAAQQPVPAPGVGELGDIRVLAKENGQPSNFIHPALGYVIAVPPQSRVIARGNSQDIAIQARTGFLVTVQTGPVTAGEELPHLLAKLEQRYLGPRGPWSVKRSEAEARIAGMEARDASYHGRSVRVRVVLAKGARNVYVLIFQSPLKTFQQYESLFQWMLAGFRPAPGDIVASGPPIQAPAVQAPAVQAPPGPAGGPLSTGPVLPPTPALPAGRLGGVGQRPPEGGAGAPKPKVFGRRDFGYAIAYPGDWVVEIPSDFTAVFSGPRGSEAYLTTVGVQNILDPSALPTQSARRAFDTLKAELANSAKDLQIISEEPYRYDKHGIRLEGFQLLVHYFHQGEKFRKWAVILPRSQGPVAHVWSFTAPERLFDLYRPVGQKMLRSWTIKDPAP